MDEIKEQTPGAFLKMVNIKTSEENIDVKMEAMRSNIKNPPGRKKGNDKFKILKRAMRKHVKKSLSVPLVIEWIDLIIEGINSKVPLSTNIRAMEWLFRCANFKLSDKNSSTVIDETLKTEIESVIKGSIQD